MKRNMFERLVVEAVSVLPLRVREAMKLECCRTKLQFFKNQSRHSVEEMRNT